MDLTDLIARAADGRDLTAEEAEAAFNEVMSGRATPVQMAALLVALRTKGHAPSEVAGGVRALRLAMIAVRAPNTGTLIDTCGTGGGAVTTFNISTAAAFVAAGVGLKVAKHGNRSFTSRSGSADVLEALGVRIDLTPEAMGTVLERAGIVFMFAPLLHPAMKHVGPVRKELRIPTIMNLLGPLTNPAGARRQVVGVADAKLVPLIARALEALGHERALVVHGLPGMDEVSPAGVTLVAEVGGGGVREYEVTPATFGAREAPLQEIPGGTPAENAALIERVVSGEERGGARTVTLLNAAAALYVGDVADDLADAFRRAGEAIDSGAAARALEALRSETRAASAA
jgi:anthranilate phosphoribosyltransferase